MRTAKRDKDLRSFKLGYNQGLKGHPKESCPFQVLEKRSQWMAGWREGHASYVIGYRGTFQEAS